MASLAERASGNVRGIALIDQFLADRPADYRQELITALQLPRSVCSFVAIRRELSVDGLTSEHCTADTLRRWWHRQPEYQESM